MLKSLLRKIFSSKQSRQQLWFAGLGLLLGLVFLMIALQLYLLITRALSPETDNPNYLVLSKKVNITNTLFMGRAEFSDEEIKELKAQPFVENVGEFLSNQYEVLAYSKGQIPFMTELFFESVPEKMLDEVPSGWEWKEGDNLIPVMLSQDMLNLYNFGYALGKGLPQISRGTAGLITVQVRVRGARGQRTFNAKIVGFSERIPSILVPESFMLWANANIGKNEKTQPSRLILKVKNPAAPEVEEYFKANNFEINQDRLQASKAGGVVQATMSGVGLIGIFFIFLSFAIFSMNFRLIMAESRQEIRLLIELGYTRRVLQNYLSRRFLLFVAVITVLAYIFLFLLNSWLMHILAEAGLDLGNHLDYRAILLGLFFVLALILLNVYTIKNLLKKQF